MPTPCGLFKFVLNIFSNYQLLPTTVLFYLLIASQPDKEVATFINKGYLPT